MRHDGHLVQGGLAVEQHVVVVLQVALHLVAHLEVVVRLLSGVAEVDARAVRANNVQGPGVFAGPIVHEGLEHLHVEGRDDLRVGERLRDGPRHAHLVDGQVWVRRDDRARGEVHALAHEIAADAAVLALEALRDGLHRAPGLERRLAGHEGRVVGDEGRVVVLEDLCELGHDVHGRRALLVLAERRVRLDDVGELVREVVLAPPRAGEDPWAHVRRRDGHHAHQQPLRASVHRVQSHQPAVVVADLREDLVAACRVDDLLLADLAS
mmetsp:Transcript_11636/g.39767  ORF Transcript_11636/g.39767 Transcript_11636/m.39767 type:complete len:267 (-) Transcript_11636:661-1461(-)